MRYSDIDLNFIPHPVTGDLGIIKEERAINQALRNILLTNTNERPWNGDVSADLNLFLFDTLSPLSRAAIDKKVRMAINRYEPRVTVKRVFVEDQSDINAMTVTVEYSINPSDDVFAVRVELERVK
jgi:phage baseplate assembly protein W